MKKQIGFVTIEKDCVVRDNGYECAAWYKDIAIKAGEYPVYLDDKEPDFRSVSLTVKGTVVADDFSSRYCGNIIGTYDRNKNVGKPSTKYYSCAPYTLGSKVSYILPGPITFLPNWKMVATEFESNLFPGEKRILYKLVEVK